ncbi:olichyl-diphosphooligosaccharide--protein glycotransferase OST4 SCDLUD_003009 [Saccharomycodes ludwigii]|uniref:olichyl-diphosphooligosaccharide--protein glycotransferase OST4 n=1 Tax=Saccharomycodes ludwigii TaxID=36035 RepID=UPI001E8B5761|nr:hypothetical protein SCDLUD_003009 [Saccharomycodes ludwigii]KAH3901513.1 hypothetical protein SCDLUD_003009 [Saccharomycodes ludwigii]
MITDNQLNAMAIIFGISMFVLIVLYGAIQLNTTPDKQEPNEKEEYFAEKDELLE